MQFSKRLERIPPYLFARLDAMKKEAQAGGVEVIDLGVGDPVEASPGLVVERLCREVVDPVHHRYPPYDGSRDYRQAVARFYERRFGVSLDPDSQVLGLIGSKEGLAHLPVAVLDPGTVALVPDPAYPVYANSTWLAGGEPWALPLRPQAGWRPDFSAVPAPVLERARLLFLNYPNNPTAATADLEFLSQAVDFARRHDLVLAYDNAYSEIYLDDDPPPSILQVEGALDLAVEFNSLSKPYNMTGWRLAYCVGNPRVLKALGAVKKNIDSGAFTALQAAGATALDQGAQVSREVRAIYRRRRDLVVEALKQLGWPLETPRATFYVWAPVPPGLGSLEFAGLLLERTGVLVSPGIGFGSQGEGYFRISLTAADQDLARALARLKEAGAGFEAFPG